MRRSSLVVLAALLTAAPARAAHFGGGGFGGGRGGSGVARTGGASGGSSWSGAGRSWSGAGAAGRASAMPSSRGFAVTRSPAVAGFAGGRTQIVPNRSFSRNEGGRRFDHFFDRDGRHWSGARFGDRFFWFPFFAGYWWWYDPGFARWDYWWDGYWWWGGPGGAPYVYVNSTYVPYDQYGAQAPQQEAPSPPSAPPSGTPNIAPSEIPADNPGAVGGAWKSPDQKRLVQIADAGAYLFDESSSPPKFMKYLGANAEKVRFSGGVSGQPLQILLERTDGGFALFDADGNPALKASPRQTGRVEHGPVSGN
jgi:hypothetical protein